MSLDKAISFHKQGRLKEAEENYLTALNDDFDNVNTLYLLGTIQLQNGKAGIASTLLKQALMLKKDHFEAWNNLGNCYKSVNKEEDARACFQTALNIPGKEPRDYADIWNNLSTLYVNSGEPEKGVSFAQQAIELVPDHSDANWNLALMYLEQGNYDKGFDLYKWGFQTKNRLYRNYGAEHPYWNGEKGKTVAVWGEQGIGDELMFASMLPDFIKDCKQVIFDCHPRLASIFKASFPNITVYGTRKDAYIEWPAKHKIDAKIAIGDLGKFYRRKAEDFPGTPYLKADPERVAHYKNKLSKLGNRLKVGISWTGGYLKTRKDYRSIPLEAWGPILGLDADFISLQYTSEAYNSIAEAEDRLDCRIHHWPSAVQANDYMETAALVQALDLVITVNTSIHHLAGGLGKECWTLTPKAKAWRYWSKDGINPWYGSVKQFEQEKAGEWDGVIATVSEDLASKISGRMVRTACA